MVKKMRLRCKNTESRGFLGFPLNDIFISGKVYDIEHLEWSSKEGFRLNGGHRKYWAINELGQKEEIPNWKLRALFYTDPVDSRDVLIDDLLNQLL